MKKRLMYLTIFALLLTVGWFSRSQSGVHAEDTRVVNVHIDGEERTIATNATTVKEVLQKLGTNLQKHDKTEPALDQEVKGNDFTINVYRARPITVVDGANNYTVMTAERSPRQIAEDAGFTTKQEDQFGFKRSDDPFEGAPGTQMVIKRSKTITFDLYGTATTMNTNETTVADLLKDKGVTLDQADEVNLPLEARITDGMTVSITKVGKNLETVEEEVAFPEEKIQDVQQPTTYRKVQTEGKNGKKLVTYETVVRNGGAPVRTAVKEVVTLEPVKQVVVVGAKLPTPANPTEAQALGKQMMLIAGYGEEQWPCLYNLWMRESGWRTNAGNQSSGAYGIPQALPASKMAANGADYLTSASTQIAWGLNYIKGRYSTPCGAWSSFQAKGWY